VVTGVNGQDGSYLAELLLGAGYRVIGTVRPGAQERMARISHLVGQIDIIELDLVDRKSVQRLLAEARPAEIYNLAARASSSQLHIDPVLTAEYNGIAVVHLLEAIRETGSHARFCQASSSEMFGNANQVPQSEDTAFRPRNAYGAAKLYAHWMISNYRESLGLFACSAILYNHESPRRGEYFVTRKVTRGAAMIKAGRQSTLELGDLQARRDWGFAGDYVRAMWLMLQAPKAGDYVVATGETHSVRELCDVAFGRLGLDYTRYVRESEQNKRGQEFAQLVGDASRARALLGWQPSVSFVQLIEMMVDEDMRALSTDGIST
jgi:GDPmannose 4,6-dehydratase